MSGRDRPCWAVIPVRGPGEGKQRLAGALDPATRAELIRAMLGHVVGAASRARGVDRVGLVGPSRHGLAESLPLIADAGGGLNGALTGALAEALAAGVRRLIVLPADLPLIGARDVERLAATPPGRIAVAPDRHGTGTNALSLPLPDARDFRFAFGTDSLAAHAREAARLGLGLETVHSAWLERDVDSPADLPDAAGLVG